MNEPCAVRYDDLEAFARSFSSTPGGLRVYERHCASSYAKFVDVLCADIDEIVQGMERNRARFQRMDEDGLTFYIASILGERGYIASNGRQQSGSVDLTVQKVDRGWIWTAEAKIFTALEKIDEGFLQLTTRYSPGSFDEAKAGMLIYIFTANASKKLLAWKSKLEKDHAATLLPCVARPELAFLSQQDHEASGLPFLVRHLAVVLHFKPKDKSGRSAKKYKEPTA